MIFELKLKISVKKNNLNNTTIRFFGHSVILRAPQLHIQKYDADLHQPYLFV